MIEHRHLVGHAGLDHLRRETPLCVGAAAPSARARTGRVDDYKIHLAAEPAERGLVACLQHLNVPCARPPQPLEDGPQAHTIRVVGVELARVLHLAREGERLATGTGAKVDDLHARARARQTRGDLRPLVLDLEPALPMARVRLHVGRPRAAAPGRDPQAPRRVSGWRSVETRQCFQHLVPIGLERVHSEIHGCAKGEGRPLLHRAGAKHGLENGAEPFRIVAANPRRSAGRKRSRQSLPLRITQRRRREAAAVAKRIDGFGTHVPGGDQRVEHQRSRALILHGEGERGTLPQAIVDETADGRPVSGAREAMRQSPILQSVGRRSLARFQVGEHFDGGAGPSRGGHQSVWNTRMRPATRIHIRASAIAPSRNIGVRCASLLLVT